jgi:hypothetical protein
MTCMSTVDPNLIYPRLSSDFHPTLLRGISFFKNKILSQKTHHSFSPQNFLTNFPSQNPSSQNLPPLVFPLPTAGRRTTSTSTLSLSLSTLPSVSDQPRHGRRRHERTRPSTPVFPLPTAGLPLIPLHRSSAPFVRDPDPDHHGRPTTDGHATNGPDQRRRSWRDPTRPDLRLPPPPSTTPPTTPVPFVR